MRAALLPKAGSRVEHPPESNTRVCLNFVSMIFLCQKLLYVAYVWVAIVVLTFLSSVGQKLQRKCGRGKIVFIVVEAVPESSKLPAADDNPGPTSLPFGRAILHLLFLRTFLHSSIFSAFAAFFLFTIPVIYSSLSAPVSPPSSGKSSSPRRRTSTHFSHRLPRRLVRSSAKNFVALLLPCLRDSTCAMTLLGGRLPLMVSFRRAGTTGASKSVDPAASPANILCLLLRI